MDEELSDEIIRTRAESLATDIENPELEDLVESTYQDFKRLSAEDLARDYVKAPNDGRFIYIQYISKQSRDFQDEFRSTLEILSANYDPRNQENKRRRHVEELSGLDDEIYI